VEESSKDKQPSLLRWGINNGRKKFYDAGPMAGFGRIP